jgi:hypothetical protein
MVATSPAGDVILISTDALVNVEPGLITAKVLGSPAVVIDVTRI